MGDTMQDHSVSAEHAKMAIGAGLVTTTALTLNEWVALTTLFYFLLQIGLLIPKYITLFKLWKQKRGG